MDFFYATDALSIELLELKETQSREENAVARAEKALSYAKDNLARTNAKIQSVEESIQVLKSHARNSEEG